MGGRVQVGGMDSLLGGRRRSNIGPEPVLKRLNPKTRPNLLLFLNRSPCSSRDFARVVSSVSHLRFGQRSQSVGTWEH